MKTLKAGLILLAAVFAFGNFAFAEWVDGDVVEIHLSDNEIVVSEIDPVTDEEELREILIIPETKFWGVRGLKDIRENDSVTAEVEYDAAEDVLKAISIEIPDDGE